MTLALVTLLVVAQDREPPASPGFAREGGALGIALAAVPLALSIGSIVAMWQNNGTTQDWLTVGSALSVPLVGLVPTFAGRSAVLPEELAGRPRVFRIIGWVISLYGTVSTLVGFGIGKAAVALAAQTDFAKFTASDAGKLVGTVTTLINAALCTTGLMFLSGSSLLAADRAVTPTVAVAPLPGGGWAAVGGVTGRW